MAEQTAVPAGAVLTGQQVLLATKLYVPRPPAALVVRRRLGDTLTGGLAAELILVSAPAGFGKTAMLADWIRRGSRPAGWLSLDAGDNDPVRFWRHVAAALDRVCPGIAEQVAPLLGPPAPDSFEGPVTALINELADRASDTEVLMVLDDYHVIEDGQVHASVRFLLEHRPPGLRLVLASRSDPPLQLSRLRARGQLAELRAADLRFTVDEAAALLSRAVGADLPGGLVAALSGRTEGWAVGLHLAGLSLRGHDNAADFVAAFSGSNRHVLDYLAAEVLDRQPAEMREFLLETSVLGRLSGELCDAVTGRTGGQAMLEAVERAGLFLTPVDEVRGWWRYHPLFADLLRARLREDRLAALPDLHSAAAAWFEGRGLVHEAIEHALAAGHADWAAGMIERNFDTMLNRAEGAMAYRWVAALPAGMVASRPRLGLAQAVWMMLRGGLAEAEQLLADAERALESGSGEPGERLDGSVSLLANVPAMIALTRSRIARRRGETEQMDAFARQARALLSGDDRALSPLVDSHIALADWMHGRTAEAERTLAAAVAGEHTAAGRFFAVSTAWDLGKVRQAQGDLDGALRAYERALEIGTGAGPLLPLTGIAYLGMADVLYERDDLDAAAQHAADGIALCRRLTDTQPLAQGFARLAWIRQARGDRAGALETMTEAWQLAPRQVVAGLLNPVPAQRARLQLARGDVAAAADWTRQSGVSAGDEPDYRTEPEHLVLARVLLAQDHPDAVAALLERWLSAAVKAGRTASTIQISALLALAHAASGDQVGALSTLGGALALARPQQHVRVFADEGAPMAALLRQFAAAHRAGQSEAASVPDDYLARVLAASGRRPAGPSEPAGNRAAAHSLAEPLTGRELEVLALLATGRSNQGIAADLTVTLDTAKKHVSHILAKLSAASRAEAVARARALGMIR
jgi:LuxR family maltose regulon positive regulatory protein